MRAYDIITHKRNGLSNTLEEISYMIDGYVQGDIPDEQIAAWLMSIYFQGMNAQETAYLTKTMMYSGELLDLSSIDENVVDKHSTGGVGDKTTLVVAPLVAAAGVPVVKLSGKGLGFTGGTIDKLESIARFKTTLTNEAFLQQAKDIGIVIIGQTANLVPADKKLYALRDVTATVDSIPLIASSIMSKKLAAGANKIVLDVKYGSGAFMKDSTQAEMLAQTMVDIGKALDRKTVAIISSMEQPLGFAIGNALEVEEAIDTLRGHGPADLQELCLTLAGEMIHLYGKTPSLAAGKKLARDMLITGKGLAKFLDFVQYQGGDCTVIFNNTLPKANHQITLHAQQNGYIQSINAMEVGHCSMLLGAGREKKEDAIDPSAGIILQKKAGEVVNKGDTLAVLHYNDPHQNHIDAILDRLNSSYTYTTTSYQAQPLIHKIID